MYYELIGKESSKEKWEEVYRTMAVHTQGASPESLFRHRRPMESKSNPSLDYRLSNHQNITKESFDHAIASYVETANNIDVKVNYESLVLDDFLKSYSINNDTKSYNPKTYVLNKVAKHRQTDPNAMLVVIPKHPTVDIIPSYNNELPVFDTESLTKPVRLDIRLIDSDDIEYVDSDVIIFEAGKWEYEKGFHKDYYYALTKDKTVVIYPKKVDADIVYIEYIFYANNLSVLPFIPIASNQVTDDGVTYYIPEFIGAAWFGNLVIGQNSDLQVCETRYSFPVEYRYEQKCQNQLAYTCDITKKHKLHVGGGFCDECGGSGILSDRSPFGTYIIRNSTNSIGEQVEIKAPIGFVTPPSDILKHSADRVDYYLSQMKRALCLLDQNTSNQSGESKRYDMMQKVTMVTNIVTDLFRIYSNMLSVCHEYLDRTPLIISVTFPDDFDVKNANDILYEITEAKKSNLPEIALRKLTKDYFIKKFGESYRDKIDFLMKVDRLFAFGTEDLVKIKAIFGETITNRDLAIHSFGLEVLNDIEDLSDFAKAKTIFDSEIDKYVTQTVI